MSDADLYDADILIWSEHEATKLRRLASGEVVNVAPDWTNIIEEIESVGRSQLAAVRSLLRQYLVHELKARAWPNSSYVAHWRSEARGFLIDAKDSYTPSMRQRIELSDIYQKALDVLPEDIDGQPPLLLPATCWTSLGELLA